MIISKAVLKIKKYNKQILCYLKSRFATVNNSPIIVIGNQKSGTSAIAHLLADFGELSKTIDIPPLWSPVAIKIMHGQSNFTKIVRRHRFYFSTELIKEPEMTFFIDQVISTFPKAKYIFVVRDPRDNIRSLLNRINVPGHLKEIDKISFSAVLPSYRVMLDASIWGGKQTENYIEALAHKWNRAVDSYLCYKDRMALAKYEDFLNDKYRFIAKLAKQLGVLEKIDISDRLEVQYQPRGNRSISWKDFFGMENLMRIERICNSRMKEFGYSITDKTTHE